MKKSYLIILINLMANLAMAKTLDLEVFSPEVNKYVKVKLDTEKETYRVHTKDFIIGKVIIKKTLNDQYCSNLNEYFKDYPDDKLKFNYLYEMVKPEEISFVMTEDLKSLDQLNLEVMKAAQKKGYWLKNLKTITEFHLDKVEFKYVWNSKALSLNNDKATQAGEEFLTQLTQKERSQLYDHGWAKGEIQLGSLYCDLIDKKVEIQAIAKGKETTDINDQAERDFEVPLSEREIKDVNREVLKRRFLIEGLRESINSKKWISDKGILAAAVLNEALSKATTLDLENLSSERFIKLFHGFFGESQYSPKTLSDVEVNILANSLVKYIGPNHYEKDMELEMKKIEIEVRK